MKVHNKQLLDEIAELKYDEKVLSEKISKLIIEEKMSVIDIATYTGKTYTVIESMLNPRIANSRLHDLERIYKEMDDHFRINRAGGYINGDVAFKKLALLNERLRKCWSILKDIKKVDNEFAKELFKRVKGEITRLNK